ncbi:bifunctional methylenetetrahydrofolate dehydrogenase/methenyltetrahydrofolate cyclohydrolase, partial [Buchnera aphidicola]|nr:bifunctional methylenetetrahydrofolate dehydrogenase/methenyltetrahydrofolate cyclohydrolase [Buchnera aphidicola]
INGHTIAEKIQKKILEKVNERKKNKKREPGLAMILIGNSIPSQIYVQRKKEACKKVGFFSESWFFSEKINEKTVLDLIHTLNKNKKIDGILLQLPLPNTMNRINLLKSIAPKKDVDGFHPY